MAGDDGVFGVQAAGVAVAVGGAGAPAGVKAGDAVEDLIGEVGREALGEIAGGPRPRGIGHGEAAAVGVERGVGVEDRPGMAPASAEPFDVVLAENFIDAGAEQSAARDAQEPGDVVERSAGRLERNRRAQRVQLVSGDGDIVRRESADVIEATIAGPDGEAGAARGVDERGSAAPSEPAAQLAPIARQPRGQRVPGIEDGEFHVVHRAASPPPPTVRILLGLARYCGKGGRLRRFQRADVEDGQRRLVGGGEDLVKQSGDRAE